MRTAFWIAAWMISAFLFAAGCSDTSDTTAARRPTDRPADRPSDRKPTGTQPAPVPPSANQRQPGTPPMASSSAPSPSISGGSRTSTTTTPYQPSSSSRPGSTTQPLPGGYQYIHGNELGAGPVRYPPATTQTTTTYAPPPTTTYTTTP